MKGYYFITDSSLSRKGNLSDVKNVLNAGVKIIQYREKNKGSLEMYQEALRLLRLCRGVTFLVNDRIDIALSVGADGVHLGQEDLPCAIARKILGKKKIIGVTAHSLQQAKQAERDGADYIGLSPIFQTNTKPDAGLSQGLSLIRRVKGKVKIPLVAIGGITLRNAQSVIDAGVDAFCAISCVVTKPNVKKEVNRFQEFFIR
ncbi:MAG: thiamine phosphate synthase [Candidatus Omnitrophota bacterium]|nr:thiamine phosphate synthase [Candidatus Omnitrophota bacterium]